jgi:hypothetical protein
MSEKEIETTDELEAFLNEELRKPQATVVAPEDRPEVVRDEPPPKPEPEVPEEPQPVEPDEDGQEPEEQEGVDDSYSAWAKRKYGDDPEKWAKAARDMESHISRLTNEKHASDEIASQWYEYAQQQEQTQQTGMPLSASEEAWIEQSLANPLEYARAAAFNGKLPLYSGVVERVAMENPALAAQIGAQVQVELQNYVAQQQQQQQAPSLEYSLASTFDRLGLSIPQEGPRMLDKVKELGEYHPYVQAILKGSESERDLAVQAVHDLTRASTFNSRQVERNKAVQREEELRRGAMVVQTGGMAPPPPARVQSPLEQGMQEEWKRSGAWPYPEE